MATRPRSELFSQKNLGARWLVFVDGLDEIVSSATRDKVIQAIARQVRKGNDYRLVVTTRPLPGRQLEPLLSAGMESFVMQPFGPDELDEFSAAWFRAQDPMTAPERAAQFAHQVQDGQLRELVRNPLLATIAAITYTREPSIQLPSNRMELYDRFMTYLFDDRISGRDVAGDLRLALHGQPSRLQLIERISEDKLSIISHLAAELIQTETLLFDTAKKYVEEKYKIVNRPGFGGDSNP